MELEVILVGIHRKGGLTFARIERKTPAHQSNHSLLCSLHSSRDQGGGGANGQIIGIKTAADGRLKERKVEGQEWIFANTLTDSNRANFVILKNHASAPVRMDRLTYEQSKEGCQPKEVYEKGRDARQS